MTPTWKLSLPTLALLYAPLATAAPPADLAPYFDTNAAPANTYRVVGTLTPPSWSWGQIELLEGQQLFRSEYYNRRTEKLRSQDTFQSSSYPLRTYYGSLNQQLVDTFNLYYQNSCATVAGSTCPVVSLVSRARSA